QQKFGQLKEAEASLLKAQSLIPSSVTPRLLLGGFYESQKRYDDARQQFESAIQVDPKNPAPRKSLATLYFAQGQAAHAEKVLVDAKAQMPDVPAGYRMLGDYYAARNETAKAVSEFAELANAHPKDLGVQKSYAQLLITTRRFDEASRVNDKVLQASPNDVEA